MTVVRINQSAFEMLVARSYETLWRETIGIVYGEVNKSRSKYSVDSIEVLLMAKRKPSTVKCDGKAEERFKSIIGEGIGGFHSHNVYKIYKKKRVAGKFNGVVALSNLDLTYFREDNPDGIEIVIALNRAKKCTAFSANCFTAGGSFSDNGRRYRFDVGAYYLSQGDESEKRVHRRARISVPVESLRRFF